MLSLNTLDVALILIYFVGMLLLGVYASRKQNTMDDYFLGGRNLSTFSLTCLWVCAWIGGSSIIGTAAYAYDIGIVSAWYVLNTSIGLVLFGVTMSKPVKRISDRFDFITITDFLEARYDRKTGSIATICILLSSIGTTASQFIAAAAIMNVLTGWSLGACYLITAAIITLYVSLGGLLAVTYTDLAQMILLIAGIVFVAVPIAGHAMAEQGVSLQSSLPPEFFSSGNGDWGHIIAFSVSSILSFFAFMTSYTRIITARSAKSARNATLYSALIVVVLAFAATFLGMAARVLVPNLSDSNNAMAELIVDVFPHGVKGFVLVGILSAIMSTADVSLVIGSTNITKDIYLRFINPNASQKTILRLGAAASFGVGVLGALLGWFNQDIMDVVLLTNTITTAGMILPILSVFFWRRGSSKGAYVSILSSVVVIAIWFLGAGLTDWPIFQIDSLWPSLAISSILFIVCSLTGKQSDLERSKAEHFYAVAKKDEPEPTV